MNTLKYISFLIVVILISCTKTLPSKAITSENIKILVFKDIKEVKIDGVDNAPVIITWDGQNMILVNGSKTDDYLPLKFSSKSGLLYINNRPFRGEIEIAKGDKGILVINNIDLEIYLAGVINHEISSKWHPEVVKAQAVVARTYALHQKAKRGGEIYHLEGTIMGQVYSGAITEDELAYRAVIHTKGETLTYNGELVLAVYHSNAGGYTESSGNVWGRDYPYLKGVESPYDTVSAGYEWDISVTSFDLANLLNNSGYKVGEIEEITPVETTSSGRIKKLIISSTAGKTAMTGENLRKVIGYERLKSTRFEIKPVFENGKIRVFSFSGRGSGHGVGLSQWGAKGMAENGSTYKEILRHYYRGVAIEKLY